MFLLLFISIFNTVNLLKELFKVEMLLSVGHLLHNFKRKCITCSHYSHAAKEKKENIVAPNQLLIK